MEGEGPQLRPVVVDRADVRRPRVSRNVRRVQISSGLVGLGLAEAPETSSYKGNPYTQVWVDLHTALYYCPGTDLYGKTPQGKLASQHDAQLDQFEPANRKACE